MEDEIEELKEDLERTKEEVNKRRERLKQVTEELAEIKARLVDASAQMLKRNTSGGALQSAASLRAAVKREFVKKEGKLEEARKDLERAEDRIRQLQNEIKEIEE